MVDSKRWGVHVSQCRVSLRIVFWGDSLLPAGLCSSSAWCPRMCPRKDFSLAYPHRALTGRGEASLDPLS